MFLSEIVMKFAGSGVLVSMHKKLLRMRWGLLLVMLRASR